jgi:hypothetical protein
MSGGDLYVRHGDAHLYGNADISGDLDVSGNTVIDGSLTVGGNLIVDGDISGNFAAGSIPATAISGGVGSALTISEIDSGNNVSGTVTDVETIRFDTDSGFAVDDLGSGAVKIKMNSTFKTWSVSGEDDLVASGLDTMNFASDSNISIATSEPNGDKTLTISAPTMVTTDTEQTITSTKTFSDIVTTDISANGHISGTDISASDIETSGTAVIGSTLEVTGNATMSSGLVVSGDASLTDMNVSGAATVGSTLGVTGNATMSSGLIVSGDASLTDVNVAGNANVGTNLGVTGSATFSDTISVTNKASLLGDLQVAGDTSLNGVYAAGNASVVGTLGVTGNTTMSSGLIVSGDASLTNLNVSGSANFENGITTNSLTVGNNTVEIDGDTNTISTTSGNLTMSAAEKTVFTTDVSVNSGVAMSGGLTVGTAALSNNTLSTTTGDLTIAPAAGNKVTISANLTVDGSVNFTGDFIKTDTNVQVTEQLDISNDGTGPAMIVTQHGAQPVAEFYDDANLTMVIKDGGDVSLAAGINVDGIATMNSGMVVSGDTSLADVNVSGTATVGSTLDVTGATTLSSALGVTGDATMSSGLIVSGDASLAGVNVSGAATIGSTLGVTGATTLSNTLAISESGAGTAASATGGSITLSHATSDGTGKNSIVFKSASDSASDYGYIQYHDDGAGGSGTQNGLLTIGVQNDAVDWGQGTTNADRIKFDVAGASALLEGRANSTGGNLASLLDVGSGYFRGIYSDAFDISDAWNQGALDDYSSTSLQDRYALYQYFDNADDDRQDMALVGFNGATGDAVDGSKPYGYMYRCSRTPNRFIAFQTIGLEGSTDSRGMKLGVSAYPGTDYEFAVGGKSHFGNDIDISGGNLDVTGTTTVGSTLGVTGATTLSSTLGVTGATTLSSTLGVTGNATMSSGLIVSGDASLAGVNASGAAVVGSTLDVTGATTLSSTLGVTGNATMSSGLIVSGDSSLAGLNVSGAANFENGITTDSITVGNNTVEINGSTNTISTTSGNLTVSAASKSVFTTDASFNNNISVKNGVTSSSLTVGSTTLSNNVLGTSAGGLTITPASGSHVTISSNLTVDGSINFTGDMIKTDTMVRVTDQLDISNDGTGPALIVTQHGNQPVATFYDDAALSMIIKNGGDVSLAGGINIDGAATAGSTLDVTGAATMSSTLGVTGVTTLSSTLGVTGDATMSSGLIVSGDASLTDVNVSGAATVGSTLGVTGNATMSSGLIVSGDASLTDVNVSGAATVGSTLGVTGNATMSSGLIVSGDASLTDVNVSGTAVVGSTLGVTGNATMSSGLIVSGDASLTDVNVSGAAVVGSTLGVTGNATMSSGLIVSGDASLTDVNVSGAAVVGSTLGVTGNATMSSGLIVSGDASLTDVNVSGNANIGTNLGVTGSATFSDTISVTNKTSLLGDLQVAGDTSLNGVYAAGNASVVGTLGVTGNAALSSGITVASDASLTRLNVSGTSKFEDDITAVSISTGSGNLTINPADRLVVSKDSSFSGGVTVADEFVAGNTTINNNTIGTTSGSLTITPAAGGNVTITSNLTVDGSVNFTGDFIKTDTVVRITEQVDVSNDGTGPAMKVTQYGAQPVAEFYDDATLTMVIKDGGDVSMAAGLDVVGETTLNSGLIVSGDASLAGVNASGAATMGSTLGVTGDATMSAGLIVSGDASLAGVNASGAATMGSTLGVTGATTLSSTLGVTGDATMSSGLIVSGDASLTGVNASGAATMSSTLGVTGATTLSSTLGVTGATTLSSTLGVTGDATMSSGLIVSGDASLAGVNASGASTMGSTLGVTGATTLSSTLGITGDATMSSGLIVSGDASLSGVNASGAATMGSTLGVTGATTLSSTLGVTGDATMSSGLIVSGDASLAGVNASGAATMGSTLGVTGATTLSSTLGVTGATTLSSTLGVTGDATMSSGLIVSGDASLADINASGAATISSTLGVTGATTLSSTLGVTGDATMSSGLIVSGDASLTDVNVSGTAAVGSTLAVTGGTFLSSTLAVTGDATMSSGLTVSSDSSLAGLNVSGAAVFENGITTDSITVGNNTVEIDGDTNTISTTSGNLTVSAASKSVFTTDASFNNNISVENGVTASSLVSDSLTVGSTTLSNNVLGTSTGGFTITPASGSHVTITSNLTVDGSINFTGDMIKTDTMVRVTDQLDISNDGTGPALIVTQHGVQPVAEFYDDANLSMIIKNGGDVSLAGNLTVGGNGHFSGDISAGAGAFTGDATAYRSITGVTGVYMGTYGNNALMNIVSEGDGADIRFSSNATGVTTTGQIIYHNESETDATKKSSFRIVPHYANQSMGLQIQSFDDLAAEVSIEEGMLTIKRGLESTERNYESYWATAGGNATLGMNQYPFSGAPRLSNAYFHIDGADGHDLLLTGHGYSATNDVTRGFNLYSKQATYAENSASHDSQGLCIQTAYNDGVATSFDFRLGIGERPKAYQFLTTKDANIGGKLDVDGSLNVNSDASFGASAYVGSKLGVKTTSPVVTVEIGGTDGIRVPAGTAAQRPVANNAGDASDYLGTIRYNTDTDAFEGYSNSTWSALGAGGGSSITNSTDDTKVSVTDAGDSPSRAIVFESSGSVAMVINSDGDVSMNNGMNIDGATTMNSTLAITESGAGTAASATGGSITLSHATSDGTGKNSIVFKSASDSGSDYGYIQYHDDGAGGSGSQNGLLTIGVGNDAIDWSQGTTNADQIKFDVAGASAYLQARANSAGENLASLLSVGSGYFTGIYSDAFDISDSWNQGALDDYSSTSEQDRFALYQYFDNASDHRQDMALVGYNGATGDAVDGAKPYGYMYRCSRTPNRFIAFQTIGLDGSNDSRGMKLGVSAYPGANYEFAVGGKSHFGNDIDISGGNLDVTGTTTVGSTLGVTGDATMSSGLIVSGDASLTDVNVSGAAVVGSTLGVTGATTMSSTLGVTGATTLSSTLGVSDAATLSSSLAVTGATTLSSTLGVTGATTLSSTLGVSDATTLSSTLGVTGATTLSSTLGVTGDATFSGDVQTSSITTSSGNLVITPGGTGKVTIASDLTVDGSVNFTGDFIKTDTIVRITEQVDVSNDGTGPAMRVTQHGDQPVAEFYDDATLAMVVKNGGDVSLAGNLTVAGAGMFTGSTDINTTTAPSGVYLGNNGSVGSQDSIIQMTSDGDYSVIDFTRNGASGTDADREGRILFANGNHTTIPYQLSFSPRDSYGASLTLKSVASGSIEADIDGMVTLNGGVRSDDRNYESADYWNASLNGGNDYRTWGDYRNAAYLYVDNAYNGGSDLLLTGHYSGSGGTNSYGYNLYSKGAVQDGVTDQGLCIQTVYGSSHCFRIGLGARPGTYQFMTTGDVKVGGKLDVDGSLNVTDATTLSSTLGVTGATTLSSTLGVTGATTLSSTLGVTGATSLSSTLTITESGTGTTAGHSSGSILLKRSSNNGRSSIVFDSVNSGDDFAYIEFQDEGGSGSGTANGLLTIGVQNDTSATNRERIRFDVAGAYAYLDVRANSSGGNIGTTFKTNYVACAGLYADANPLDDAWDTTLTAYSDTSDPERSALYMLFDNAHDSNNDLAFTGMNAAGGSTVDGSSKPYGYMLRSRSDGYIAYQTGWVDGVADDKGLALGVNAFPGRYYDFAVGGKSYLGNTLTIEETGAGTAASATGGTLTLSHTTSNGTGKNSIVFKSSSNSDNYGYIEFADDGAGSGNQNGILTIGIQDDTTILNTINNNERMDFTVAGTYSTLYGWSDSTGTVKGSQFRTDSVMYRGIDPRAYNLNTVWGTTMDYYDTASNTNRYTMYQYFDHTQSDIHDMALVGYNAGSGSGVNPDGNLSYGYMYRSKNAPNKFISFQTRGLRYGDNSVVDGMRLGVNAVPGYTYDFAVGGQSHFGNNVDMCGNLTVGGLIYGTVANGAGQSSIFATDVSMHADLDISGTINANFIDSNANNNGLLTINTSKPMPTYNTSNSTTRYSSGRPSNFGVNIGMHKYWYTNNNGTAEQHDARIDLYSKGDLRYSNQINFYGHHKTHFAARLSSQADHDGYGVSKLFIEGTRSNGTVESFAEFGMETVGNNQNTKIMKFYGSVTVNGSTVQTSDLTLKTDIETLESSLDKICRLRGVSYRMKEDYDASSIKQLGLIAQEVEVEYPELVLEMQKDIDRDGVNEKYKGLNYANLTAPMVEAIKELKDKNDALEAENTLLKNQMQDVLARLTALENK